MHSLPWENSLGKAKRKTFRNWPRSFTLTRLYLYGCCKCGPRKPKRVIWIRTWGLLNIWKPSKRQFKRWTRCDRRTFSGSTLKLHSLRTGRRYESLDSDWNYCVADFRRRQQLHRSQKPDGDQE